MPKAWFSTRTVTSIACSQERDQLPQGRVLDRGCRSVSFIRRGPPHADPQPPILPAEFLVCAYTRPFAAGPPLPSMGQETDSPTGPPGTPCRRVADSLLWDWLSLPPSFAASSGGVWSSISIRSPHPLHRAPCAEIHRTASGTTPCVAVVQSLAPGTSWWPTLWLERWCQGKRKSYVRWRLTVS